VKKKLLGIVLLLITLMSMITVPMTSSADTQSNSSGQNLPRVALASLWNVPFKPYMAKFVGDDYIVIFTNHGDVSLNGRYISTYGTAYIYQVSTGKQIGIIALGSSTYEVTSWDPFQFIMYGNTPNFSYKPGFFSADSNRMIEDPEKYGTNAHVVDTTTWSYIPIDWGFSDTAEGHFYAAQLDYSGSTLAVGYIGTLDTNDTSKLLVYKYDVNQGKYVKSFEYTAYGDYGRRLQMTLDGKVIVVGGKLYGYLDIFQYNGTTYNLVVHYKLPDSGGLGALGISDPWKVGYIIAGTLNGWVIIAQYDPDTGKFSVTYQNKDAPDNSWLYNPFYDRWVPKVTEVFALCTHDAGVGIVYDTLTNQTITVKNIAGYAAAVSPTAKYVFLGNTLFLVIKRDVQATQPRVRFWGETEFNRNYQSLASPLVFEAPNRDWHLYFYSGRLTISKIYIEPVPVDLVNDPDITNGRLSKMYIKGLIDTETLYTNNAEVKNFWVVPGTEISDLLQNQGISNPNNYIALTNQLHFTPPPYFWEGEAWYGTVIHIPIDKPISIYDDLTMQLSTSIHTSTALYDKNKRALGIIGVPVEIGGGVGVGAEAYSKIADSILAWYMKRQGVSIGTAAAVATTQSVAKVAGIVGLAVAAWGGVDAALVKWGGFGNINYADWIVIAPTVVDQYGNKYTAIKLVLPLDESNNVQSYYDKLSKYFKDLGYLDIGFSVDYPCKTWDEYKTLLASGYAPQVRLDTLIQETIATKYNLDMNKLKIKGVDVFVITNAKAKETFWEWLFGVGGVDAGTVTLIGASTISVKGKLKAGVITDPTEIASIIGNVSINGDNYQLNPGSNGAYADFAFNLGEKTLSIDFGGTQGYYADVTIDTDVLVKKDFSPMGDYGYTTTLQYDWNDTSIRINSIEFTDMPYPMLKAERIFIYKYGNFTNDITSAFELSQVVNSTLSPTGQFYYYITQNNTKYIDPANGGIMQPGKIYVFNYFYKQPPDVGIMVYLNGTKVTSTLAQHATVVINSTVAQDVNYTLTINVKYFEGTEEKTVMSDTFNGVAHVPANGTTYDTYDITKYVDAAIEFMRSQNKTAFVEFIGNIVYAPYDYYKTNDEYRVVYYPPPLLPSPIQPGTYNVTIRVYEYVLYNYSWIPAPNATVKIFYGTEQSELKYNVTTDNHGVASVMLDAGTWTFIASKLGFVSANLTAPIYNDTTIQLYLAPYPEPNVNNSRILIDNVNVTVFVYDATTGRAVPGAGIVFQCVSKGYVYGVIFRAGTGNGGTTTITLPIGTYLVTVNATGYRTFENVYIFDKNSYVGIGLIPESANLSNYAMLETNVLYSDGKPYEGAYVSITNVSNSALIVTLTTDSFGNATMLLPINQQYNVSVVVNEPLNGRSYRNYTVVNLINDTVVSFVVPWNSPQPPIYINGTPFYWLSVQVIWSNGLPFEGAVVEVYNATSEALIGTMTTDGTGTVHFLLPAFQVYIIQVNATNPYNTSQTYANSYTINLTDNVWLTVKLTWIPEEAGLANNYTMFIYAYDPVSGKGIDGATVLMLKGNDVWFGITNSTGYASLTVPFLGLYYVTATHPNYYAVMRSVLIFDNNSIISLPMLQNSTNVPPPPLNSTEYPPIYINGIPYYWLSVQALYKDGYPFTGANVTVINTGTNQTIISMLTDSTGFVNFLIPANLTIKYTIDAVNPNNVTQTYHDERILNMTQHYYFAHLLPWVSQYYTPEVWMMELHFVINRGQGYFLGNVSHLIVYTIWTNKPQNVTVYLALYNVSNNNMLVGNKTVQLSLNEGINTFFDWIDVNASAGGYFQAFANITQFQYDTNLSNNWLWSEVQYLKPYVDIQVFALWRPVEQKQDWTILPEDIIEIDIGIVLPINISNIPAMLDWKIEKYNLMNSTYDIEHGSQEEIRVVQPGIVWRNITISIPWTSKIVVLANVTHVLEDYEPNNFVNITINIDPDVKIELAEKPSFVMEGGNFKVVVNITSNVEPGKGIGWVSLVDNTTNTLIKQVEISLQPQENVTIEAKAPQNPASFGIFRTPTTTHQITAKFVGYDLYPGNNEVTFNLTITSYQFVTILAVIIIILIIIAVFKALTHSIADVREDYRKFVKRKTSLLLEAIEEIKEESKFVKKKNK